jgi:pimeloyl-ACP methyl ester carboxylesterase
VTTLHLNDADLAYHEQGSGDPPLLLLHGFTGSRLDWADVVSELARDRRVVAYDQRGHGDSTNFGRRDAYTFTQLVADLAAVVDAQGLAPFDLLGHSMGGVVAMGYALAHADKLRSLILMDTAGAPAGAIPQAWVDNVLEMARRDGMGAVAEMMIGFLDNTPTPPSPAGRERLLYKLSNMDVEAFAAFASELNTYRSQLPALAALDVPTTVIVGANDAGLRAGADDLAATIPNAQLVVIPDAGHSPQEDQPAAWLAAVRAHLERAAK